MTSFDQVIMSHFADGENIHFTICILSKPNLSITVTETVVKGKSMVGERNDGNQKWNSPG